MRNPKILAYQAIAVAILLVALGITLGGDNTWVKASSYFLAAMAFVFASLKLRASAG